MFLLLCQSLVLAEEKEGIGDESVTNVAENLTPLDELAVKIAEEILTDYLEKQGHALRLAPFLHETGYKKEVAKNTGVDILAADMFFADLFFNKYTKKYKYKTNDASIVPLALSTFAAYGSMRSWYMLGMRESLHIVFNTHKGVAKDYKNFAPQLYEQYLENKKESKGSENRITKN